VIGEDFDVNLRSSQNAKTEHEWIKAHESRDDGPDTWERRRRKLRDETLNESPPTAVLSVGSGWRDIECERDPSLLQQLADEVLAGRVDQVTMRIKWVDGLAKKGSPGKTLWLQPYPASDPIHGHVTHPAMNDIATTNVNDRSRMNDRLTSIWERALQRSPIPHHANFFDLGGDSLLVVSLFLEIERELDRSLPITAIYDAPTPATMAALLE
jgi:acyl carrier protein